MQQRLKNLEKKSVSPNTKMTDDTLYMGSINSAELIEDTHQEDTLTKLAKANIKPADKLIPHPSSAQGFVSILQQLKNLISSFLTNMINFFKKPDKPLEPINTPLKPITNEIASTVTKKPLAKEPQPKDWHKRSSIHHEKQVLVSTSIDNNRAQDIHNLQKEYKAGIAARKQALDERGKKISEKQSSNSNRPR